MPPVSLSLSDSSRLASSTATTAGTSSTSGAAARLKEVWLDLAMAECAVTKFEGAEGGLKCLMFACLAGVVLLGKNTLA